MARLRPTRNRYVTRVFGLYAQGTYRSQYVQRIPLYTTLENSPAYINVGAGTVEVLGYAPTLGQQENTEYAVLRTVTLQRRSIGTGVYRRDQYRKIGKVIPFQRIVPDKTIRPGAAEILVEGYPVTTDPRTLFPGAGVVEINGKGPSVFVDGVPVKSLPDALLMAMQAVLRRRKYIRHYREFLREPDYRADFIELTRTRPSRFIGVGSGVVTVTGFQVTLTKRIAVGVGEVEVEGYSTQTNPAGGAGEILVEGYQVTITAGKTVDLGVGTVELLGYAPTIVRNTIDVGAGLIEIVGYAPGYSLPEKQADPGAGVITVVGAAPTVIATGGWNQVTQSETTWGQVATTSDSWEQVAESSDQTWTKI